MIKQITDLETASTIELNKDCQFVMDTSSKKTKKISFGDIENKISSNLDIPTKVSQLTIDKLSATSSLSVDQSLDDKSLIMSDSTKSYNVNYSTLQNMLLKDIRDTIASLRVSYDELQKKVYAGDTGNQVDYVVINGKLALDVFEITPTFNNLGALELSVRTSYGEVRQSNLTVYHAHTMLMTQTAKVKEVSNNATKYFVLGYERQSSSESAKHIWRTGSDGLISQSFSSESANTYPKDMKIKITLPNFAYNPSESTPIYSNGEVYFDDVKVFSALEYAANQNIRLFADGGTDYGFKTLDIANHVGGGYLYYLKIYDKANNVLADFRPHVIGTNVFLRDINGSDMRLHFVGSGYLTYPS